MSSADTNERENVPPTLDRDVDAQIAGLRDRTPSVYSCPDCGGVLWQADAGEQVEFLCHVGHRLSAQSLMEQQVELLEEAGWTAVRVLTDRARLSRQLEARAADMGDPETAERLGRQAATAEARAEAFRRLIEAGI